MSAFSWLKSGAAAPALTDTQEVNRRFHRSQWSVLLGVTLGYGSAYTCRLGIGVIKEEVIREGIFTPTDLGTIGSGFFFAYGLGKLVNGPLADRTNVKRFWALGLALSAIVNLLMGSTTLVWLAVTLWALNGWFQGFLAPSSAIAITQWFHPRERGSVYGIWSASHSLGEGATFVFTALVVGYLGWRFAYIAPGLYCLVVAVCVYLALKDRPETYGLPPPHRWRGPLFLRFFLRRHQAEHRAEQRANHDRERLDVEEVPEDADAARKDVGKAQLAMFLSPALWILGLSSALMYVGRYAVNSWGYLYLQTERGFDKVEAGGFLALNTVLGILGSPLYGFISDRFFGSRRPPVTLLYGIIEIVGLALIFFGPHHDTFSLALGWALYGFSLSGLIAVLGGLFAVDICEKRIAGAAMGFVGGFSYVGAFAQELISGWLIERGMTEGPDGPLYDFTLPVAFWFGSAVLSAVLAASLWRVRVRE